MAWIKDKILPGLFLTALIGARGIIWAKGYDGFLLARVQAGP